jgi:hypothetical protein
MSAIIPDDYVDQLLSAVNAIALLTCFSDDDEVLAEIRLLRETLKASFGEIFPRMRDETDRLAQTVLECALQRRYDIQLGAGQQSRRTLH